MNKLYVIDASGYIYRAYFAIREMTNAKGESTNALFGFIRSILKLIKDFNPTHLVSVFDGPNNASARTAIYADYKAHRSKMPGDLLYQIMWAQQFCTLLGIPELMVPNVEADDTMGSVAKWAAAQGSEVYLCTSDKDMLQLVDDKIFILNTFKDNLIINANEVEKQFGVRPNQMVDYLAITGDASDNVPGLTGFGPKTAAELLKAFGSLDELLVRAKEVPGAKKQETLLQERDKVLLSRRLVTVDINVPIPTDAAFYHWTKPDFGPLRDFYAEMNFATLTRELEASSPRSVADESVSYQLVDDEQSLDALIAVLSKQKEICIDTESTAVRSLAAELIGIGFGFVPNQAWYVPTNGTLGLEKVIAKLKPLLENSAIGFYGHNIKDDSHVLANHGIHIATISFDTMVASYLLNSHIRQHTLDHLALELFGKVKTSFQDLIGKGKQQLTIDKIPLDKMCVYCCENIDYTVRLKLDLEPKLKERNLHKLMTDLELPLLTVLAKMERHGIFIDTEYLKALSDAVAIEIRRLEEEIYQLAGEPFNLNSPKQLSGILFEKMGIRAPKKTATGLSTNADVLESLKDQYPIAGKLLEYRALEKLRSTYIDTLPAEINAKTGRIHCTFNQTVAATGRLSCQDPNLQNIPVRTQLGLKLREAFRPQKPGWSYLAADYSQIELRLLAHLSEDPNLVEAFRNNEDIHVRTAALIFGVFPEAVTKEMRFNAKAVNFGIIYGQQAFGLAQELGVPQRVAADFIERYFDRYKMVKAFVEQSKEKARREGRAVTFTGRERLIPEINSKNGMLRAAAERLAVNTPLQGSQADIIKAAMLRIDRRLAEEKKKGYMILQIHDELVFELPDEEIPSVSKIVKEEMEGVMSLKVPLVVDIHVGKNWKEC